MDKVQEDLRLLDVKKTEESEKTRERMEAICMLLR